jgi:hypothetical protein
MKEIEKKDIKTQVIENIITAIGGIIGLYFKKGLPKENVMEIIQVNL